MMKANRLVVTDIPRQRWFDYDYFAEADEVVNNFSAYAEEHGCHLILELFEEANTEEQLDLALEQGMYDFIYPEKNIYSADLKALVEKAEKYPRFLGFDVDCVCIEVVV